MSLSDRAIRALKPAVKHQFIADGNGLYLRVHPSGTKSWVYRTRKHGKPRWLKLGVYPTMSLLQARQETLQRSGMDIPEVVTLEKAYNEYFRRVVKRRYARPDIIDQRVQANLKGAWFKKPIGSITRVDVSNLLQTVVDRGAPVMANRLLADIKHIMDYAVERGWIETNPAAKITRKTVGGEETPSDRTLSSDELKDLIGELVRGAGRMEIPTRVALGLLILTGQRASEVLGMSVKEVDGAWWSIPSSRLLKSARANPSGRPHKVYLSPPARAIWRYAVGRFGARPFSSDHRALSHALRRLQEGFTEDQRYTPHDLRRTMATHLADLGVAPHVVEKMLNHQMAGVMSIYNRSEYMSERRAAWRLWGLECARLRRSVLRDKSLVS